MEKIKVGINGFGRIGRLVFAAATRRSDIEVVGINDLLAPEQIAYLLRYDSIHGGFQGEIQLESDHLVVHGKKIRVTAEKDPADLRWDAIGASYIVESTGLFLTRESAGGHIRAGAKKVVLSAPSKDDIPVYVMGVNHQRVKASDSLVSNASCTTNCLAPLAQVIHDRFGIAAGLMTTVHAATSTQRLVDGPSKKNYRLGRSALVNIIPTTTGAAKAVGRVIPELDGRLTGMAMRVPTADVSVVDLTLRLEKATDFETLAKTVKRESEGRLKGILKYTDEPVVSSDFIGETHTCVFDAGAGIMLNDRFVKLIAWYDNEVGYSDKLVDLLQHIASL